MKLIVTVRMTFKNIEQTFYFENDELAENFADAIQSLLNEKGLGMVNFHFQSKEVFENKEEIIETLLAGFDGVFEEARNKKDKIENLN